MRDLAKVVGRSEAWVSRVERGLVPGVSVAELAVLAAAAGLRLWIATYPGERAIRDAPQLELLRHLRERLGPGWTWSYEVLAPDRRDLRAADAVIRRGSQVVMIEAFTRLADAQAQIRAVQIKARDLGIGRVVLAVKASHTNRRALHAANEIVDASFPLGTREVLAELRAGRAPDANGLVLL
jgi:hypothetical protein